LYRIATLIPTINRPTFLRSLESVANQTRIPDEVIILSEKEIDVPSFENLNVTLLQNTRSHNLSGALNSGLEYLLKKDWDPEGTYISILDDDDEWEPTYLQRCYNEGVKKDLDMVITGIIRHTSRNESHKLEIPNQIDPDVFLITNPHIQGSNLFVKFSTLLMAGCFDERLESTTDRDICYRLFELDIKYDAVDEHLVHHWALDEESRLSSPSSQKKKSGLNSFYQKYSPIMTDSQKTSFKERAQTYFGCRVEETQALILPQPKHHEKTKKFYPIIIGFISSNLKTTELLLRDIQTLFRDYQTDYTIVVCDNTTKTAKLGGLLSKYIDHYVLCDKKQIDHDCDNGLFGSYFIDPANRMGIASGRTNLHRYVYDEMRKTPGSVAWIIDDDVRLETLQPDGTPRKITIDELNQAILSLKKRGVAIANGMITGDPPIPVLSTIRTQLLDLSYNQERLSKHGGNQRNERKIFTLNHDYYYDLSETDHSHLETPEYIDSVQSSEDLDVWVNRLMHGSNVSRPIVDYPHKRSTKIPPRGGNTLVLNPQCLRDYPNIAPKLGTIPFRRGDTLWCILNYYHGGGEVSEFPLSVRQTRYLDRDDAFSYDRLLSDFYGSSFSKALEEHYSRKNDECGWNPRRVKLGFDHNDIEDVLESFRSHLVRKINIFIMNAYRIQGLIRVIKARSSSSSIINEMERLEQTFCLEKIWKLREELLDVNSDELRKYLIDFTDYTTSYRDAIRNEITQDQITHSRRALQECSLDSPKSEINLLGYGNEGAVFTDEKHVYKHFYYGKTGFPESRYEFIKQTLLGNNTFRHFPKLLKVVEEDGELVFIFPYEESSEYRGGKLRDIQVFLKESKKAGIVVTNVHPKNFVVANGVLKHIDIGRSIIPYSEKEFRQMCKRAYLTYRWHFREDISQILSAALHNENMPELFGFQYFIESLKVKTKSSVLDDQVVRLITRDSPRSVLDYGCGTGKISEELSKQGFIVVGYDIDDEQIMENRLKHSKVKYLTLKDLVELDVKFDKVLCCLVLCTIVSDDEVDKVVKDLRKHVDESGEVLVLICNPFNTFVVETETHVKGDLPDETRYHEKFSYLKHVKETSNTRKETHRPYSYYEHLFRREGLEVTGLTEINSTEVRELAPASDFMMIRLKPLTIPFSHDVSLMIKASAMEWKSVDFQIKHIVNQLEGPQRFKEIIVVTDNHLGPYLRQYTEPNFQAFMEKLNVLKKEGAIDRVIVIDDDPDDIRSTMKKWFNIDTDQARCSNGQPTYTFLKGFEEVETRYFLHVDSDCVFIRKDRDHDYLGDMVEALESDPEAISVSFNIAHEEDVDYSYEKEGEPWRIEARCSLMERTRLLNLLPLPNHLDLNGLIKYPWHRALDQAIRQHGFHSYRGGDERTYYIHVPNNLKTHHNQWYNVVKAAERGQVPQSQIDHVDLQSVRDWFSPVEEEFVLLVRGLNVPIPKLRRCLESILSQDYLKWKVVFIDAGSTTSMQEYLDKIAFKEFEGRCTFWFNHECLTSMENIYVASTELCLNPESIIVHLDADDAFINTKVLGTLRNYYEEGADLTVGSMLRTDKHKEYPVNFDARGSRGGNVWQHLRSYRKHLFDKIPLEYFKIQDKWVPIAEDWAFMIPLTELAISPVHITEPLYFYQPRETKSIEIQRLRETIIKRIVEKPNFKDEKY